MTCKNAPDLAHLPGLDGLRGLACLMVFAVHFGQKTQLAGSWGPFDIARFLKNGNLGVALFFALSGFLLSLPYWRAQRDQTPSPLISHFLAKRLARVLPAYYCCLTILVVVNRLWQEEDWTLILVTHSLLVFNYLDATIFRVNPPFWTIAVEVQFYVLLPILLIALRRVPARFVLLLLGVCCACAYGAHWFLMRESLATSIAASPVLVYSLLAHLPHFLLGVATAMLFAPREARRLDPRRHRFAREILLWGALCLIAITMATPLNDLLQIPFGRYNLPYLPIAICVVLLLLPISSSAKSVFDQWPLRAIGVISYGVYIYHLPIQNATARFMDGNGFSPSEYWLAFGFLSLAVTLIVATISYWLLEKPILKAVHVFKCPQ